MTCKSLLSALLLLVFGLTHQLSAQTQPTDVPPACNLQEPANFAFLKKRGSADMKAHGFPGEPTDNQVKCFLNSGRNYGALQGIINFSNIKFGRANQGVPIYSNGLSPLFVSKNRENKKIFIDGSKRISNIPIELFNQFVILRMLILEYDQRMKTNFSNKTPAYLECQPGSQCALVKVADSAEGEATPVYKVVGQSLLSWPGDKSFNIIPLATMPRGAKFDAAFANQDGTFENILGNHRFKTNITGAFENKLININVPPSLAKADYTQGQPLVFTCTDPEGCQISCYSSGGKNGARECGAPGSRIVVSKGNFVLEKPQKMSFATPR